MENNVTEFILMGLTQNQEAQQICFFLFILFYMILMTGNFLIIMTIQRSPNLNSPMYFFLSFLSFVDICYSSVTAPKMITDFQVNVKRISLVGCMAQLFFVHLLGGTEIFILTVMAYDRYVAICKPLHYLTIMDWKFCSILVVSCWLGGFVHTFIQTMLTVHLPFCGPSLIDHYFCDVHPLLKLACTDTYVVGLIVVANSGMISLISFVILVGSYTVILLSFKTRSSKGRRKALSTCASHITVVILYFVPCIFIYLRPSTTFPEDKMVALFYTIITPMLNPLIYSLRNVEVKNAMRRLWIKRLLGRNRRDPDGKFDGIAILHRLAAELKIAFSAQSSGATWWQLPKSLPTTDGSELESEDLPCLQENTSQALQPGRLTLSQEQEGNFLSQVLHFSGSGSAVGGAYVHVGFDARPPSPWFPEELEWEGVWRTELPHEQGPLKKSQSSARLACQGQATCAGPEAIRPHPAAPNTPGPAGHP
ncbi:olfactory receptor 4S2-like [Sus scrofa]|uniref:olfactory receptor 4S2-like n=1 Tax=Sus scrofa TaxID=9823 RepID=UPI00022CE1C8|nr:olfactory receptor 4S2-like [Sus scrofa]